MIDTIHFFMYGVVSREIIEFTYYAIVVIAFLIVIALARDIIFWTCVIAFTLPFPVFLIYMLWQHKANIIRLIRLYINKLRCFITLVTSQSLNIYLLSMWYCCLAYCAVLYFISVMYKLCNFIDFWDRMFREIYYNMIGK